MDIRTEEQKVKDINARLTALKQVRLDFEADIDQAITYVCHGMLKIADTSRTTKGKRTGIEIYDDTAVRANNLRANGLHGYLFSPGWFKLKLSNTLEFPRYSLMRRYSGKRMDEIPEVAEWLDDAQEEMYSVFTASNWYQQTPEIFRMSGAAGTVPVYVERDMASERICFTPVHVRECWLSRNRFGDVDGLFRVYDITLKDLRAKFGEEKLVEINPAFKQAYESNPYQQWEILHAVFYRDDADSSKLDARNKRVASFWIYNSKLLLESGYDYFPWVVHEERRNANEWYSRSPGFDALVAILTANQMGRTNMIAAHMAAEPPYAVHNDLRGKVNIAPRGRTYVNDMDQRPMALQEGLRGLPFATEFWDRVDRAVNEYFHTDIFLMMNRVALENKNLTATQVIEMSGEKAAVLSPETERIERGTFNPVIDIVFALEYDANPSTGMPRGRIPAPPQIMFDMGVKRIDTDYYGPLSQARQRFYKAQGLKAGISDIALIAQLAPQVLDIPDWDKLTRHVTKEAFPADFMHSDEDVAKSRQARAQQQAAAQMQQGMTEMAGAIPGLSKAIEPNSPLAMLGSGS